MITVSSYSAAIIMCFITMLCWGSWANTQKMVKGNWPFPLFYWDYSIGVLLFSLALAFTAGSFGSAGRAFLADISQAQWQWLGSAFIGGAVFNIANILLVAAIEIAGLAVAFPVGIGLALVLGVVTTYLATPEGNVPMLACGRAKNMQKFGEGDRICDGGGIAKNLQNGRAVGRDSRRGKKACRAIPFALILTIF